MPRIALLTQSALLALAAPGPLAAQTLDHRMKAPAQAVRLRELDVEGQPRCTVRPQEGLRAARVWEEARKAVAATVWGQRQRRFRYEIVRFERTIDLATGAVTPISTRRDEGFFEQPFASLPAAELAEHGYVREFPDGTTYYAPDAEVLLSDPFLDGHCFRVRAGQGETAGLIGLAFEPLPGRRKPDVHGVLWLDPATAELRHLEFGYAGLDIGVPTDRLGGRVELEPLSGGAWIIRRWWIRTPAIAVQQDRWAQAGGRRSLTGLKEDGGEVTVVAEAGRGR